MSLPMQTASVLVLDTMVLSHFTLAERLDVLRDLLLDADCWTTHVVLEELRAGSPAHPEIAAASETGWLHIAQLDTLDEIRCFTKWVARIGSALRATGARLPCSGGEFPTFARKHKLL